MTGVQRSEPTPAVPVSGLDGCGGRCRQAAALGRVASKDPSWPPLRSSVGAGASPNFTTIVEPTDVGGIHISSLHAPNSRAQSLLDVVGLACNLVFLYESDVVLEIAKPHAKDGRQAL